MGAAYRQAMDLLYLACASLAGAALVLITLIIPWGVFTRYGLNSAASWPEPAAILLAIVLTFFGAAACYRVGQHMQVTFVRDHLPPTLRRLADIAAELLVAALEHRTISLNRGDSGLAENVIHFRIGGDLRCRSRIPLIFASVW
jgi:TRAP-type C4-dicarboxylate transport system permease small subunit